MRSKHKRQFEKCFFVFVMPGFVFKWKKTNHELSGRVDS